MKKILQLVACLNIGVSSIAMGATLDVIGESYLVGIDKSTQEIKLIKDGEFNYDPRNGRFGNKDVDLLAYQGEVQQRWGLDLERLRQETTVATTTLEFFGNISSGAYLPIGDDKFQKTQRVFDSLNNAHDVVFKFTRLPAGINTDNKIQYSVSITVDGGSVKRFDANASIIDTTDTPMIVTFNDRGELNLFDYGQESESCRAPRLYIDWKTSKTYSDPLKIDLNLGAGKGVSSTRAVIADPLAVGNLTAYAGTSLITHSYQNGGRFFTSMPLTLSSVEQLLALKNHFNCVPPFTAKATTVIEFSGNISSGRNVPIGDDKFQKTQRVFDSLGMPHEIVFKFTRMAGGADLDNKFQYSVSMIVAGGTVKRTGASGSVMDTRDTPMIVTFNDRGELNLFDYGLPTESDIAPSLYIEWTDTSILAQPLPINLKLGQGKGQNPTFWRGIPGLFPEENLTAYDGNSLITYSGQDGVGVGEYERISMSERGSASATYSNGLSLHIGRLIFATVPSPAGLEWASRGYRITESSGFPTIAAGGQAGWGFVDVKYPFRTEAPRYLIGWPVSAHSHIVGDQVVVNDLIPVTEEDQRRMAALRGMVDAIVSTND